jgi:hypothetical protein
MAVSPLTRYSDLRRKERCMGKRLSDADVARYGRGGFLFPLRGCIMSGSKWRRTWPLALILCLAVAGCTGTGYAPAQDDQPASARSGSGGGDSGGSSM